MPRRSRNNDANLMETTIETHSAGRIRLRRGLLGMSQSDLAKALGITFQQVQKYERGSNRVSVGKLYRLADILDVPLTYFFDGLVIEGRQLRNDLSGSPSPILSRRELDLLRAWKAAPPAVADEVLGLLRAVKPGAPPDLPVAAADSGIGAAAPVPELEVPLIANAGPAKDDKEAPAPIKRGPGRPKGSGPAPAVREATRKRHPIWNPSDIRGM